MNKINNRMLIFLVVVIVILYLLNSKLTSKTTDYGNGSWAVYGTKGCGWTNKQIDYMNTNNIPHKFVDCDKEKCDGINAYPTMKSPNGQIITGFTPLQ